MAITPPMAAPSITPERSRSAPAPFLGIRLTAWAGHLRQSLAALPRWSTRSSPATPAAPTPTSTPCTTAYTLAAAQNCLIGSTAGNNLNLGTTGGTNIINSSPELAPLAYNGGNPIIETMALEPGSPALGMGDPSLLNGLATDERGQPRVVDGTLDIGAYEHTALDGRGRPCLGERRHDDALRARRPGRR